MSATQLLALLLAISIALHVAVIACLLARQAGVPIGQAILGGAGAAATVLSIYLAGVSVYH